MLDGLLDIAGAMLETAAIEEEDIGAADEREEATLELELLEVPTGSPVQAARKLKALNASHL